MSGHSPPVRRSLYLHAPIRRWSPAVLERRRAFAAHPQSHLDMREEQGHNAVHGLWFHRTGDPHELMTVKDLAASGEPLAAAVWELQLRSDRR